MEWSGIRFFRPEEFQCRCCHENRIRPEFVQALDTARQSAGIPFLITSGWRCPDHNREVGGVPDSSHCRGWAADIAVPGGSDRFIITQALLECGFTRVGIGSDFIHADCDPDRPSGVIWVYA